MLSIVLTSLSRAGSKKHGSSDVSVVVKGDPEYICPAGFYLSGKMCTRENETSLMSVCQEGQLRNDMCVVKHNPNADCPNGFHYDGHMCVLVKQMSPVMSDCPDGFALKYGAEKKHGDKHSGAYCEKGVINSASFVCPQGTMDAGHNCLTWSTIQPTYECPEGTMLQGQYCQSFIDYDCSPNTMSGGGSHGKKHHLRLLGEKKHDEIIVGSKGYEENRIINIAQTCRKTIYDNPILSCPPESVQDGKSCKIQRIHQKVQEKGIMTYITEDLEMTCPEGGNWCNAGKKHGDKKHHGPQCCIHKEVLPSLNCPSGYDMEDEFCVTTRHPIKLCDGGKKKSKKGGCSSMEFAEPIITFKTQVTCQGKDCGSHHKH